MKYQDKKLGRKRKGVYVQRTGFYARYPGQCFMCTKSIKVGDRIDKISTGSYYHVDCDIKE